MVIFYFFTSSFYIVCVTEQHYVSIFFTRLWSVHKPMLFYYKGRLVTNQQKRHFSISSLHFCLSFGFVFIHMRSWSWNPEHNIPLFDTQNPEISGFCVSKSRGLRTDHKRVKNIERKCCSVTQTMTVLAAEDILTTNLRDHLITQNIFKTITHAVCW